jgi:nitrate/TMAO reductase-like tetraheme cytochrome c subunit
MKKLFILFLMTIAAACTVRLIPPTQSDVDRVSAKYPGYSLTELNEGKALFVQTCNRCHRLKNPTSRNEIKWAEIVPTMIKKLNKKEGKVVIDDKQQESILRYIITMNSARKSTM